MKKNYMKPEVNEVEVAANQAIASCAVVGYKFSENQDKAFSSPTEAWNAPEHYWNTHESGTGGVVTEKSISFDSNNRPYVYPIIEVQGFNDAGRPFSVMYEDRNTTGTFDSNDTSTQTDDVPAKMYGASNAVVVS